MTKEKIEEKPFTTFEEIEDVRIIIKSKGKNYSILPKGDKEEAKQMRIIFGWAMLENHYVVTPSLEEIKLKQSNGK